MINNCSNKNPLLRDGTSQQQRLLKALLPGYVSVDERSMDDLVAFARKYATEIQYYGANNLADGDWKDFFMKDIDSSQRTEAHYTLFIAFLEMFRFAQDDLNTITQRHLEFYYKDVLRIKEKEAIPDQVFVIFELAKNVSTHLIEKGTVLNAGKDKTGKQLFYAVDKNIVVNTAKVKELKALYYDNKSAPLGLKGRLYASPIANSANGKGEALDEIEPRWRAFGMPAILGRATDRTLADTGLALSSPVLELAEGSRTITIELTLDKKVPSSFERVISNAFRVSFSGEKGWIETPAGSVRNFLHHTITLTNKIYITRTLTEAHPAITKYNQKVHKDPIRTSWPVVRLLLNAEAPEYPYELLNNLTLTSAAITVNVSGVKNIMLQNDLAKLDPSKPFQPFTSRPVLGSSFYIGSNEIFRKHVSSLNIHLEWQDLPDNFTDHYKNYINYSADTNSYSANISLLQGKGWKPLVNKNLFEMGLDNKLSSTHLVQIDSPLNDAEDPEMEEVKQLNATTANGFIRLDLAGKDFGHKQFHHSYTAKVLESAKQTIAVTDTTTGKTVTTQGSPQPPSLPNEPYTPVVKSISLDYTSSVKIEFASSSNDSVHSFFHYHPFGTAEVRQAGKAVTLLPAFNAEGNLYIGLEGLVPSQIISLLFKVAEGSADPELLGPKISWSYLSNNQWKDLTPDRILTESTNDLATTGIITFDIPKDATTGNTILNGSLHWLKASVQSNILGVCDLIDIRSQAITATFTNSDNDPHHLAASLAAGAVKELETSDAAIKKVQQPYASFNGKMQEAGDYFYMRVSERLRHKHRAITIWDYEHLVLDKFPSVYKVKCLNHTINKKPEKTGDIPKYSELAPGHITLLIISNLRNKNAVNPLRPKTSLITLKEIQQFITQINPPCSELHVVNPFFEEIKLHFNVRFLPGYDSGFYRSKLEEDLKQFLAPWAYNAVDVVIGGKIHSSVIINFIEEREYVDFVACFKMDLIDKDGNRIKDIAEASPTTASSILTSAASHDILVLADDDCRCNDNIVLDELPAPGDEGCECDETSGNGSGKPGPSTGIGKMKVGATFIIGFSPDPGIGYMEIENDFDIQ
jgi:hypothetical protein